jgi:tetratricopeptide (TPR) repeat protein
MKGSTQDLLDLDEAFARGEVSTDALSGRNISASLSLVLRHYHGRNDLTRAVQDLDKKEGSGNALLLEQVRSALYAGEADRAAGLLASAGTLSPLEEAEFAVEKLRLHTMRGELEQAWASSEFALGHMELLEISRMTCYQMRGSIRIRQGRFLEAVGELEKAVSLAEFFPHASSAFNSYALLVQAFAELGQNDEARRNLEVLERLLAEIEQPELWLDRLLSYLRSQSHARRASGEFALAVSSLTEAEEVAAWLGDKFTRARCESEIVAIGQEHGFREGSAKSVFHFSGWSYLPERDLILIRFPKRIVRLGHSPLSRKVLLALADKKKTCSELFEQIWNLSYDSERHGTFLRSNLSKIRKLLPKGALQVVDGEIYLV